MLLELRQEKTIFLFAAGIIFLFLVRGFVPPWDFPVRAIVNVEKGSGLYQLSEQLEEEGIIRSPFWFRTISVVFGGEREMKAGQYYFEKPENAFSVAWRILAGDHRIESVKLTVPEGFSIKKISALFDEERFTFFDNVAFEQFASEGYMFPDTYFVPITATASSTIKLLRDNFERKIFPLIPEVESSGRTLEEIVTMASIIEGEANTPEDREIVSSILWKRLEFGLPLQVDAAFVYINGKTTKDLTQADLNIDSPFNTYLYAGLPPAPISNPGIEAIKAAIHPTSTSYLYFLTGNDGKMYYSRTFDEHIAKKQKYIKR